MARVLVVDDEQPLTHALTTALTRDGYDVLVAHDAERGVELAATAAPDLVVLDLGLPDVDGVELTRRLRGWSSVPILILSGTTEESRRVQALDAGADDFLQKPFGLEELAARLRALARRTSAAGSVDPVRRFPGLQVDLTARKVSRDGTDVRLTPTEWRLLELFVTHPDRLLTHRWLLHRAWTTTHGDETRDALRAHIRSLRAKLGDDAQAPRYLRTESGAGYRWIAAADGTAGDERPVSDVTGRPLAELGGRELAHELNNALTAMRMAVQLLKPRPAAVPSEVPSEVASEVATAAGALAAERVEELVARVNALALELERRVVGDLEEED